MHRKTRLKMTDLNPLLTCKLCKGYLIDATTLTECLHSFCRSCLVRYLCTSTQCPSCDTLIHKTRPLLNTRVDRTLQNVVYKLTPGLFKDEMRKRREFYAEHPGAANNTSSTKNLEDRGEVSDQSLVIYSDDENMNLSLEYYVPYRKYMNWLGDEDQSDGKRSLEDGSDNYHDDELDEDQMIDKRYLRCPAAVCVKHIKKFIRNKFDLKPTHEVEVTHFDNEEDPLPDDYTLMDVAYIYAWRRSGPLPLVFRIFQLTSKRQKVERASVPQTNSQEQLEDENSRCKTADTSGENACSATTEKDSCTVNPSKDSCTMKPAPLKEPVENKTPEKLKHDVQIKVCKIDCFGKTKIIIPEDQNDIDEKSLKKKFSQNNNETPALEMEKGDLKQEDFVKIVDKEGISFSDEPPILTPMVST